MPNGRFMGVYCIPNGRLERCENRELFTCIALRPWPPSAVPAKQNHCNDCHSPHGGKETHFLTGHLTENLYAALGDDESEDSD